MFFKRLIKNTKPMLKTGSLNRLLRLVNFINCDTFSDLSKSKAQTTKVYQPRACLLIAFEKLNYKIKLTGISFSSLPDG